MTGSGIVTSKIMASGAQRGQAIMQFDYAQMKWILPKQKKQRRWSAIISRSTSLL